MPSNTQAVNLQHAMPQVFDSLAQVHVSLGAHDLAPSLVHLVHLRASQINQCGFCVKMHSREAREAQESNERLDRLIVWRHVSDFSAAERAALAWTEALTVLDPHTDYAPLRSALREHFNDGQIAALTGEIGMINLWNRLQVSRH
ncbi:carboxymuconolactone decarboxylase family protein [Pseudomonas sp. COR58]|uniref:Carboxymuconolactone decarboxylase family protein n=1 Tax=Pseudomonas ekonensis TaxID=2842353 RepID=A0ABS6PBP4_9PSED|nr:carboxymuconolactone decarboxylase family protein [Pseudomonas ekonensis]MBV4457905.1 carboxymuconolactone decarboxylase family protein [Pseudomonas ekonensis]